jgi:hypothetical protein
MDNSPTKAGDFETAREKIESLFFHLQVPDISLKLSCWKFLQGIHTFPHLTRHPACQGSKCSSELQELKPWIPAGETN